MDQAWDQHPTSPREFPSDLPSDLPRSLNDRRRAPAYSGETELYDAWQGE
jgi:hypothetical protein